MISYLFPPYIEELFFQSKHSHHAN